MRESNKLNFRTVIKPVKYNFKITYKSNLMFMGSCFTENIGKNLKKSKFKVDINPFGILYNHMSVKITHISIRIKVGIAEWRYAFNYNQSNSKSVILTSLFAKLVHV